MCEYVMVFGLLRLALTDLCYDSSDEISDLLGSLFTARWGLGCMVKCGYGLDFDW